MGSVDVLKGGLLRRWMIDEECRRVAFVDGRYDQD
jgi:hypothetical protein